MSAYGMYVRLRIETRRLLKIQSLRPFFLESKTDNNYIDSDAMNDEDNIHRAESCNKSVIVNKLIEGVEGPLQGLANSPHRNMDNDHGVQKFIQEQVLSKVKTDIKIKEIRSSNKVMKTSKLFQILILILVLLTGCKEEKCIKVNDAHGTAIENSTLKFSATIERNEEKMGWSVTSLPPLYEVIIGITDKNGEICFSDHKNEDSIYLYKKMRTWKFYADDFEKIYYDFESIPLIIELEKVTGHDQIEGIKLLPNIE